MPRAPDKAVVSLAPMLSVRRGADAVAFYKTAFGANELIKIEAGGSVKSIAQTAPWFSHTRLAINCSLRFQQLFL